MFHPLDFREVVGKAIGRDESHARISFQSAPHFIGKAGAAIKRFVLVIVGVDGLHIRMTLFQRGTFAFQLRKSIRVVRTYAARPCGGYFSQESFDPLIVPHVLVSCGVLFFLFADRKITRTRYHHRRATALDGKALVIPVGKFSGVSIQKGVDFCMEHGINTVFLFSGKRGCRINQFPIFFSNLALLENIKAVHIVGYAGSGFINSVIHNGSFQMLLLTGLTYSRS